jgi:hypothetical protein
VWRWFERADKQPFFFDGIWRPWTGDRGTRKMLNIGDHTLFSIMTTEPNAVVEPIHEKAMPVMLMTPDDVDQWLRGVSVNDAPKMQKPAPDDAIVIRPTEKESGLASSIHLAAGQFAATRHGAPRRFGETLDGIRMPLGLLNFVEPIVVHTEFPWSARPGRSKPLNRTPSS